VTPSSPHGQLQRLVTQGRLGRLDVPNLESAAQLLEDAQAHARGVDALVVARDWAGALLVAYELGRKAALATLLTHGYRPAGQDGEHAVTFEAADHLLSGGARQALRDARYLRRERNDNMYRQVSVAERDAVEAQGVARAIAANVLPAVARNITGR